MSGAPRVVHVVEAGGMYGIERMLAGLLPALRSAGWDARLLSLSEASDPGALLAELLAASGVPVQAAPLGHAPNPARICRLWRGLRSWVPAIVHTHGYKATIVAGLLGRLQGQRMVGTHHTEAFRYPKMQRHFRVETRVMSDFAAHVAVSPAIAGELRARGVPPERVHVIPNGIADPSGSEPLLPPPKPRTLRLAFLGRLVEGKDVHLLVESVRRLNARGFGTELVIAGEGPRRAELEAQVADAGLVDGAVRFLGFVDEPGRLLASADVFVLPSQNEGMPISLIEAMACGLPIVASEVGGVPSTVQDGKEALLVPAGDQEALDGALLAIIQEDALRRRLGDEARRRFEREWTAEVMAGRYASLYRKLLAIPLASGPLPRRSAGPGTDEAGISGGPPA